MVGQSDLQEKSCSQLWHCMETITEAQTTFSAIGAVMLYAFGLAHSVSIPEISVSSSTLKSFATFKAPKMTRERPPLQTMTKATSARFAPIASPVVMYFVS